MTLVPVSSACTTMPPPMYMTTWYKQVSVTVEDEVTRLEVRHRDVLDLVVLLCRTVRERDTGLGPCPHGQARAVETGTRGGPSPDIGDAELALGCVHG